MNIGGKDFLVQQNWVNPPGGSCVQNLGHNGFYVNAILDVPVPIKYAGTFWPSSTLSLPASGPTFYQWIVTYSNNILPPDTSAWVVDGAFSFGAPSGNYTITLSVTPKDVLGPGFQTTFYFPVCTGGTGAIAPNTYYNCNPPPPPKP